MNTSPIFLVDDDPDVRDALSFLLGSRGLAVQAFDSGPALLAMLDARPAGAAAPRGVFMLDVRMEPMSGTRLHDELLARRLRNPVLFLTGHGDIPMVVEALKKGAFDFLEKPYSDNALADRIEQALAVDAAMQEGGAQAAERQARLASLTERETEVMQRVAAGKLNKVIADELHVSVRTIEVHRARVFAKLGVRSAAEVATLLAQG
ncbi:two-component system response regulator DctR [Paucibacter oligotrophus]|uniref:Two-component system response regulator DctR n=1 Tax=Roseateles oligotrophus TaxID=1769250 RepID=A0A840LCV4_9BURK|nr:response regulator [Roseateles oligotrophus]MBB4844513.1 two-component system response regulator DctR [Roseateles oligotrophus]